jgi:hypothetical protein
VGGEAAEEGAEVETKDDNYNPFDEDEKAVGFEMRDGSGQAVAGQRNMHATSSNARPTPLERVLM